ncbi:MAG: hypothetical protein ACRD3F_07690, partial [Acidobacteriaceae bacterium]
GGDLRSAHLRMAAVPLTGRVGLAHAAFHAVITQRSCSIEMGKRRLPFPIYEDAVEVVCRPSEEFLCKTPLLVEADGEVLGMERAVFRMAKKRLRLLWPH